MPATPYQESPKPFFVPVSQPRGASGELVQGVSFVRPFKVTIPVATWTKLDASKLNGRKGIYIQNQVAASTYMVPLHVDNAADISGWNGAAGEGILISSSGNFNFTFTQDIDVWIYAAAGATLYGFEYV